MANDDDADKEEAAIMKRRCEVCGAAPAQYCDDNKIRTSMNGFHAKRVAAAMKEGF